MRKEPRGQLQPNISQKRRYAGGSIKNCVIMVMPVSTNTGVMSRLVTNLDMEHISVGLDWHKNRKHRAKVQAL